MATTSRASTWHGLRRTIADCLPIADDGDGGDELLSRIGDPVHLVHLAWGSF